jgi:hypothetical protein
MRYLKLICFLVCICGALKAQYESDRLVMGGGTLNDNTNPTIPFRNSIIYFNEQAGIDSIDAGKWLKIGIYYNASSSSTWSRDTVMYVSNGYRIVNQRGQVIDPKILNAAWQDGPPGELVGTQNPLFLSIKNNNIDKLYLFYGEYGYSDPLNTGTRVDTLFSYAELNPYQSWPTSNALISKNNILIESKDTTQQGCITACRHANGRDWWILKPGLKTNEFYKGLFTPYGIEMAKYITSAEDLKQTGATIDHFSVDGNYFVHYVPAPGSKRVYRYTFDRCNGELLNPELFDLSDFLPQVGFFPNCLSPDGSKLYIFRQPMNSSQQPGIIQYDFETEQANYLGQDGRIPFLSPNGKEVLFNTFLQDSTAPVGFAPYLSVIKNPNASFNNLEIEWHKYSTTNALGLVPPNLAYYRLGVAQGTVCDSLGLSAEAVVDLPEISLFPNPSNGVVQLRLAQWPGGSYTLHNSLGQQVAQAALSATSSEQIFTLAFQHLPDGLYFLSLRNPQGQLLGSKRLMIRRE